MILLYTGAQAPDLPQPQAGQSIGGFISATPIINGGISNIFPVINNTSGRQVRMICLKNTTGAIVNSISIWTVTPTTAFSVLKLGFVQPAFDTICNRFYFEELVSPSSLPYQATLQTYEGVTNAFLLSTLAINAYIGIWIDRELIVPTTTTTTTLAPVVVVMPDIGGNCSPSQIAALQNAVGGISTDNIQLIINYT